ncbi:MAG: AraC family transcriptional regulator [Rhizobacter sp.]|nr:AraC family transcriptional regulator [Rhizobacter sp.]
MRPTPSPSNVDRLSSLLERFRVRTHLFHSGPLCGVTHYAALPGRGFLHVLRRGEMVLTHRARSGAPRRIEVREPSLLFYPRPLAHDFHNAPAEGCDFTCAAVEFQGGENHPLARALPPVVVLPLAQVAGLEHTLDLLFAETEQVRCGHRLLADRLFEVLLLQLLRWLLDHPEESGMPSGLLTGLSHPHLAKALVALHERPGEAWTLPRMAAEAGMSRSAFAAAFKLHVGEGPAEYLAQWRLAIVQTELRKGVSLKSAAEQLGYSSTSALSRVFAQKVGTSPREWLKRG